MTPLEIEEQARNRYNSIGTSFWSSEEIMWLIYDAELELSREALLIESTYTTSTVASQHEYSKPTNSIALKRVTYEGIKLTPISMVEDDAITANNQNTTGTGTPRYYYEFEDSIFLRPIPSAVGTLKIFSINEPDEVTSTSVLEIPTLFHMAMVDRVVREMVAKDQNWQAYDRFDAKWEKHLEAARRYAQKKKRRDQFASVKNEEWLPENILGIL